MSHEREIIDGLMSDAEAALVRGAQSKASTLYHGILRLDPYHSGALRQLAAIAIHDGEPEMALGLFERARQATPADADLCHGIATALRLMGRPEDSDLALQAALRADPTHGPSLYDRAMTFQQRGDHVRASKIYLRLTTLGHGRFDAMFNRGVALYRMGNLVAAERWFHVAALLDPASPLPFMNLGMIYRNWGFVKEAVACQEKAVELAPDNAEAHWNLANALLVTGDFKRGFAEYEWRFRREGRSERPEGLALGIPRWSGEDLTGKTILITLEQGLGDAIHFVRFAEALAKRGARVVWEAVPTLAPLLATAAGIDTVVAPGTPVKEAAYYLPLMSLPHILGVSLADIPARVPYLSVPKGAVCSIPEGKGLRVGLVWRGNPQHENDRRRSLPLEQLAPLGDVANVSFYSLQVGDAQGELAAAPWAARINDLAPSLKDFAATAAAIAALDLVISVDTAVAHVAGALGKNVWVPIPPGNDWRWLSQRADSPWYPTLKLFRQPRGRDWKPTVNALVRELTALAATRS